ncbi:LysR family transcriptional regulator [Olsenella profusa]|uniref:LysR family transcriptional regulator n=1 Tax=Olsenella profusa TaxID=138595 RepID=A0ABS2F2C4_9ACTN|nr:LysR family transcriptional regulator [Olsenella profusa]MBM6775139.1 LysR family transcriptional regulator [Olsenella profusa]
MNVKQLRYVCSIVDAGSFSAAAAREGVSVQAVSKSMAELEGRLGTPLFERLSAACAPRPSATPLPGRLAVS